jgi:uncharacterized protein (DUF58 family)
MSNLVIDNKKYLDPAIASKLNSLELKARLVVEGFIVGLHKSPYHGFSAEFSEHRPYMQGDNLKSVDWKIYGKTEKYFIKQFEEETNLKSYILLDMSKSMGFASQGNIRKLDYGLILAASLSYMMLRQQDAVGISLYSENINHYLPPKASRSYLHEILKVLNRADVSSQKGANLPGTKTAECLNEIADKINRRGLVIIISDFFDKINTVIKALKHFRYKKNEVIIFQILDPLERSFAFGRDAVFKDMETGEELATQPYQIQRSYREAMDEFIDNIRGECRNSNIEYNLIETSSPFDKALLSYIQKRKKLY